MAVHIIDTVDPQSSTLDNLDDPRRRSKMQIVRSRLELVMVMAVASSNTLEVRPPMHASPDYATLQAGDAGGSNLDTAKDSVDLQMCFGLHLSHHMCSLRQLKSG
jgi:hypothetical protein